MVNARLATVAPDLAKALEGGEVHALRRAAAEVASAVVSSSHLTDPRVDAAMRAIEMNRWGDSPDRTALRTLAEELEDRYFGLQLSFQQGGARQHDYLQAFARARAASALWFALDEDPVVAAQESIYEASASIGGVEPLREVVMNHTLALTRSPDMPGLAEQQERSGEVDNGP